MAALLGRLCGGGCRAARLAPRPRRPPRSRAPPRWCASSRRSNLHAILHVYLPAALPALSPVSARKRLALAKLAWLLGEVEEARAAVVAALETLERVAPTATTTQDALTLLTDLRAHAAAPSQQVKDDEVIAPLHGYYAPPTSHIFIGLMLPSLTAWSMCLILSQGL